MESSANKDILPMGIVPELAREIKEGNRGKPIPDKVLVTVSRLGEITVMADEGFDLTTYLNYLEQMGITVERELVLMCG